MPYGLAVQDYNKFKDGDVMIARLLGTPETNAVLQTGQHRRRACLAGFDQLGTLSFNGLVGDYNHSSSPAGRTPPRETPTFKVNPAKPGGLEKVQVNVTSDLAKQFTLPSV